MIGSMGMMNSLEKEIKILEYLLKQFIDRYPELCNK